MQCRHCQTEVTNNYCPTCGHPKAIKRLDWHYIVHDLFHVLHLETGIFSTVWKLLTAPGRTLREFISEDRTKIVKPVLFLVLTSLVYTLMMKVTHVEDQYIKISNDGKVMIPEYIGLIFEWVRSNYGYSNLLMSIFIALWLRLFFRKFSYNLVEWMVILCYTMGMGMLFYFLFGILSLLFSTVLLNNGSILAVLYTSFAIGKVYNKPGFMPYFKAFWAYVLGFITFAIVLAVVGVSLDIRAGNFEKFKNQKIDESSTKKVEATTGLNPH